MNTAIELIAEERKRQIEVEGFTPEHDLIYKEGELAQSAACYMMPQAQRECYQSWHVDLGFYPRWWPKDWNVCWWKPTPEDRIRELVKACALGVAEIERLQRIEQSKEETFVCCTCKKVLPISKRCDGADWCVDCGCPF